MKKTLLYVCAVSISLTSYQVTIHAQSSLPPLPYYLQENFDETGRPLPRGVPKVVNTNGVTISIPMRFTSAAYQKQALGLVIQEANAIAKAMNLPEELPITETNLVEYHISPFGFAYGSKEIGFVASRQYIYYVSRGNKFSHMGVAGYDQECLKLQKQGRLPISHLDTNTPYQLATQWLALASMDFNTLNHDCKVHVDVTEFWSGLKHNEKPKNQFVPIYFVSWISPQGRDTAYVELYLPSKKLLQMSVEDPKYILRKPIVFTNLDELFPGNAPIHTNYYVAPIYMSLPRQ